MILLPIGIRAIIFHSFVLSTKNSINLDEPIQRTAHFVLFFLFFNNALRVSTEQNGSICL